MVLHLHIYEFQPRTSVMSSFAPCSFLLNSHRSAWHGRSVRPLHEQPWSEVAPRSLISSAVGLWFQTEEQTGRCVSDRKSKGSWKGGTEREGRSVFVEVKVTVCQGGAVVGSNQITAGNPDASVAAVGTWKGSVCSCRPVAPGRRRQSEAAAQQPPSVLISPRQRPRPLQLLLIRLPLKC